ncbi:MAG TPA: MFS transporter [Tepidisphaeraceae bacterium]|jgi:OPA family glycerol-3-phosphate transporter-like MFS transporter/OPA family sugar phosphate sensor protein UhpC-like MFS transporter
MHEPAAMDERAVAAGYRAWRRRVMIWSIIGYALFYFVRKNLPVAMPVMEKQLGVTKQSLGLFLTLHGVLYGISKFANGIIGDRVSARWFMAAGLLASALLNVWFGMSSWVVMLGIAWMLNGWVQGVGFPPCARLMTHWFEPRELATKMSIWNTSHSIGTAGVFVLCGWLVSMWGDWRLCFYVPAALAAAGAILLVIQLPDTPASVGLPELATTQTHDEEKPAASVLRQRVFSNPYIWLIALANFFVYTIRYGMLDWGPTMLKETRGIELKQSGLMLAAFEGAGLCGMLAAGWLTDRIFKGRGARMCLVCMILCAGSMLLFWRVPQQRVLTSTLLLMLSGFFIYGPQALVGISVANLATKKAAATAVGLTGIFGYASTVLSGWGLGWLVQHYGWDRAFEGLMAMAVCGIVVFAAAWPAPAHGYRETNASG